VETNYKTKSVGSNIKVKKKI